MIIQGILFEKQILPYVASAKTSSAFLLCSKPQVLLVEIKKAEAFIQKNKSSFDIMEEVTSTAKNKGGRING